MQGLRERRKRIHMTQSDLAHLLGVSTQAVSHYEKGIREPNIETLIKLSKALNCTVDDLIYKKSNENEKNRAIDAEGR